MDGQLGLKRSVLLGARYRTFAVVGVVLAFLVAAGGAAMLARQPEPSSPTTISIHYYPVQPDDWTAVGNKADIVVMGAVQELGRAGWTSPTGEQPSLDQLQTNLAYQLRTPVTLAVDRTYKGDPSISELSFSFVGGETIDLMVETEELETFVEGRQVIVFLGRAPSGGPADIVDTRLYPEAWLTVRGDTTRGSLHDVPLSEVIDQLERLES